MFEAENYNLIYCIEQHNMHIHIFFHIYIYII